MSRSRIDVTSLVFWGAFAAFAAVMITPAPQILPTSVGHALAWLAFFAFLGYSLYCSRKESLFATLRTMSKLHWGRQITLDLYIGLSLSLIAIYLTGGGTALAIWALPLLIYGNIATLLYVALHFVELAALL